MSKITGLFLKIFITKEAGIVKQSL